MPGKEASKDSLLQSEPFNIQPRILPAERVGLTRRSAPHQAARCAPPLPLAHTPSSPVMTVPNDWYDSAPRASQMQTSKREEVETLTAKLIVTIE
eukprot:8782421-Pyramimonas_sp.AAC.2